MFLWQCRFLFSILSNFDANLANSSINAIQIFFCLLLESSDSVCLFTFSMLACNSIFAMLTDLNGKQSYYLWSYYGFCVISSLNTIRVWDCSEVLSNQTIVHLYYLALLDVRHTCHEFKRNEEIRSKSFQIFFSTMLLSSRLFQAIYATFAMHSFVWAWRGRIQSVWKR